VLEDRRLVSLAGRVKDALLVNRTWKQIVLKNMVWATLAEAIVRGLKLLVLPLVARAFGPAQFGQFAFAYSFASMFDVVYDAGLALTTTRELAAAGRNAELLPDILLMKVALGVVGMSALGLGMVLITRDQATRISIVVLGIAFFVLEMVNLSFSVFRARQRMEYEFLVRIAQAVFLLSAVGVVAWRAPTVLNVSYAYLVSGLTTLGLAVAVMPGGLWRVRRRVRGEVWGKLLRIALPLALAGGATTIYMNVDSVMLGAFGRITETGWYNLATRIMGVLLVPTSLMTVVIFPAFASTVASVDQTFRRRWDAWSAAMIALGFYVACAVLATSDRVVQIVFGPDFHPTSLALKILAITVLLIFMYTPSYQAMIVFDRQRLLFWTLFAAAVMNVTLNVILIPVYGLYGSAWAVVVTHVFIMCILFVLVERATPLRPLSAALIRGALGSGISACLAYIAMGAAGAHLWVVVPVGAMVFSASLFALSKVGVIPARAFL